MAEDKKKTNEGAEDVRAQVRDAAAAAVQEAQPVDVDVVTDAFLATYPKLTIEEIPNALEDFKLYKPALFVAQPEDPGLSDDELALQVARRELATELLAAERAVDVDVVTDAFLAAHTDTDTADFGPAVEAYVKAKPALFLSESGATQVAADRYIVETDRTFELLGSTVTFRAGQIIRAGTRHLEIARAHDVPLRPLAPISR